MKEVDDYGLSVSAVRPKADVTDREDDSSSEGEDDATAGREFSEEQIYRTTRLARDHGFDRFDSGRAQNASYDDTQFFELQTFMGMVGCGTAQGVVQFKFR